MSVKARRSDSCGGRNRNPENDRMADRALNILLVEDDEVDVMNVRRAFERNHMTSSLFVAVNGLEALDILHSGIISKERRPIPLDLNMPQMNVIEFLDQLRSYPYYL